MTTVAFVVLAAAATAAGQCVEVAGDRVRAGDIAPSIPEFSAIPADREMAISPLPGVVRHLRPAELSRVLGSPVASGLCVVRRTRTLIVEEILAAMRGSIADGNARISIVDYSRAPVPQGTVEFPLSGLGSASAAASDSPVVWRGRVRYDGGRTAAVWARVRLSTTAHVLVARRQLRAGEAIQPADVEDKTIDYASLAPPHSVDPETLARSEMRRDIAAGTIIESSMLRSRTAVQNGDTIRVSVKTEGAELRFETSAASTAHGGDRVLVRNPINGRMVSAVLRGDHEAVIEVRATGHVE